MIDYKKKTTKQIAVMKNKNVKTSVTFVKYLTCRTLVYNAIYFHATRTLMTTYFRPHRKVQTMGWILIKNTVPM